MWLTVFWSLLVLILFPILKILLYCYRAKRSLRFYEKQGFKTIFSPLYSVFALESPKMPGNETVGANQFLVKLINSNLEMPGIAVNMMGCPSSMLLLYKPEYIKEFLLKEDDMIKMPLDRTFEDRTGLFFYNGDKAMAARALFMKIFNYDNISTFTPEICKVINAQFDKTILEHQITDQSFTKINLDKVFEPIFEEILNILVFGKTKMPLNATGHSIYQLVYEFFKLVPTIRQNPVYAIMPKITLKYELLENIRIINKYNGVLKEQLKSIYEEYDKAGASGECVLDKIIQNNRECIKNNDKQNFLDDQELVGMVNVTVFAGTDTSQNQSKQSICQMTDRQDLQELFDEINADIYDEQGLTTAEKIDSNQSLSQWIKESHRLCGPIGRTNPRFTTKDITLKDIKIKKGDRVCFYLTGLNMNEAVFPDANTFKMERFSKENEKNIPKYQQLPFLTGKRICPGRHLGELMVKLIVTQFCRHFEFRKPAGMEYYVTTMFLNRVQLPEVEVKLNKRSSKNRA